MSPQLNEHQKKGLRRKIKVFFSRNQVNTKKKVFTAIWDYIRPEFVGFIRAGWLLFVSSSSAQISMGGRLNLDGGTLNLDGETLTLDGGRVPPTIQVLVLGLSSHLSTCLLSTKETS